MAYRQQRAWGGVAADAAPRFDPNKLHLVPRTARGGVGGHLPPGAVYYAGEDSVSGDTFAVFRKPAAAENADGGVSVMRICRVTGKPLAEAELGASGVGGFGAPLEGQQPTSWTGNGWSFTVYETNAVLQRIPQGGVL